LLEQYFVSYTTNLQHKCMDIWWKADGIKIRFLIRTNSTQFRNCTNKMCPYELLFVM